MDPADAQLLQLLLSRLERVSADSYWAHRASGIRGALLRALESLENGENARENQTKQIVEAGFSILEAAAKDRH